MWVGAALSSEASRLMALFSGLARAHGTHGPEEHAEGREKVEIKKSARTIQEPVTEALWQAHIDGKQAIGIIPITDENTCHFAAIDIDDYGVDHAQLISQMAAIVPAAVCKSKSGGAHIFVFFSRPLAATLVVDRLHEIAENLGYPKAEIFPKQTHLTPDGVGNWINMPYFGGDATRRPCLKPNGMGMSLHEFLQYAEARRVAQDVFVKKPLGHGDMGQWPPCLQHLFTAGIRGGEGIRNGMFDYAILAKRLRQEGWEDLLRDWNKVVCDPPLTDGELQSVIRSVRKKDYSYKCAELPIVSHCQKQICMTREHGVGAAQNLDDIASIHILQTEPPLYTVDLRRGGRVECNGPQLMDPNQFAVLALQQARTIMPIRKKAEWVIHLKDMIEEAEIEYASDDVSITGQFKEMLESFLFDRHAADDINGLMTNKPWFDEENDRVFFILSDLTSLLNMHKFRDLTRAQISVRLKSIGGQSVVLEPGGRPLNAWCVPMSSLTRRPRALRTPIREDMPI